jgi:hypothetical protein
MSKSARKILSLVVVMLGSVIPAAHAADRPFSPTSFWNAPLAADAPLDGNSAAMVTRLRGLLNTYEPYINTTQYSTPVYTVGADQPRVHVTLDNLSLTLQNAFDSVPLPANAIPSAGTDGNLVLWDPSTDTIWDFWRLRQAADGWHAVYGGRLQNASTSNGVFPNLWGASASGMTMLGGLMRLDELAAGHIDHALSLSLPEIRAGVFSLPATRTDGKTLSDLALPEGARLRIDPNLDLSKLRLSPITRMMAEAAQKYGIVIKDRSGSVSFSGEDPTPTGTNPYAGPTGFFGGKYIGSVLRAEFPWSSLQVLRMQLLQK